MSRRDEAAGEAIPKTVSRRLSRYLRALQGLAAEGSATTSSQALAERLEISAAQVRKDLAYFGQFGQPGVGYRVAHLIGQVRRILGTDRRWPVALVGLGRLGQALLRYPGFAPQGFHIEIVVEADPALIGGLVEGRRVIAWEQAEGELRRRGIALAILAVPAASAQEAALALAAAGVRGLLNFAPRRLQLPPGLTLIEVDLAVKLEQLSYALSAGRRDSELAKPEPGPS